MITFVKNLSLPKESPIQTKDETTESRIKEAARKVFHKKGYAATRTRDIAAESGINLALLNYYFRSKHKLFEIIMEETMVNFLQSMILVVNNEETIFLEKIEKISSNYIDLLIKGPNIPVFIMSELQNGHIPAFFTKISPKQILMQSKLSQQWEEEIAKGHYKKIPLIQMLMNVLSLCVFPFISAPMLKMVGDLNEDQFTEAMLWRKGQISAWVDAMLSQALSPFDKFKTK